MSKSEDIDWDWIRFCYVTLCGNSIEDFYDATFPEIIYQIRAYKKFNTPPDKKQQYNNNNQQQSQGDTVCYGRVDENGNPMTLEQIMSMG